MKPQKVIMIRNIVLSVEHQISVKLQCFMPLAKIVSRSKCILLNPTAVVAPILT